MESASSIVASLPSLRRRVVSMVSAAVIRSTHIDLLQVVSCGIICLLPAVTLLAAQPPASAPKQASPPAATGPTPPKIEAFLKQCETSRRGAILKIEHELRGLQRTPNPTPTAARQMAVARERLRVLKANSTPVVSQLAFPLQAGAIGRLPELSCHVDQVLGPHEMLVRCQFSLRVVSVERFRPRADTVIQSVPVILRGPATANIQEGADVTLTEVFEVAGKESTRTANGGAEKLQVLNEFDMQAVLPYFERLKSQAK